MQQVEPRTLKFKLSQTQGAFLLSDARYVWLIGAEREGKTFSAICAIFSHQQRCAPYLQKDSAGNPLPMQGLVIRDTHESLKRHFVKSVERDFPDLFKFKDDYHKMIGPGVEIDLLGMNNPTATSRIQGGQYDFLHIEEPAPMFHTGNAGIHHDVFLTCARRISAGGKTPKRLQVTMNPAPKTHWTYKEAVENPLTGTEVFWIKSGENKNLSDEDRRARAEVYRNRPDLAKRYDQGQFADVFPGVAVTPEFNEDLHVAKKELLPSMCNQLFRFYDGGLNPTMIVAGISASTGQLLILDCVLLQNGGMRQLIEQKALPLFARPRYSTVINRPRLWRDIGDASLDNREQSDSEHRASLIINALLKANFEQGVQQWDQRREALKDILTRMPGGKPFVQVNPRVTEGEDQNWIRSALSGGYHYKVTPTGEVLRDGPDKTLFSHPGDALSHGVARLFFRAKADPPRKDKGLERQRAKGYSVVGA